MLLSQALGKRGKLLLRVFFQKHNFEEHKGIYTPNLLITTDAIAHLIIVTTKQEPSKMITGYSISSNNAVILQAFLKLTTKSKRENRSIVTLSIYQCSNLFLDAVKRGLVELSTFTKEKVNFSLAR